MELSMGGRSKTSLPPTSPISMSATSSLGSGSGPMFLSNPDGPGQDCGPGRPHFPASLSAEPEGAEASTTLDIYGPSSSISSASRNLQSCLASKFRVRTDSLGSKLYSLTWNEKVMSSGRSISRLAVSGRRTGVNGSTGLRRGWPTPRTSSANCSPADARRAQDGKGRLETEAHLIPMERQLVSGPMLRGWTALTGSSARLNPDHARWLISLPAAWSACALMATLSSPKQPPISQQRSWMPLRAMILASKKEGHPGS